MIKIFCIYIYLWDGTTTKSPRKVWFSFRALPTQNSQARPLNKYSAHHIRISPTVTRSKLHNVQAASQLAVLVVDFLSRA